MYQAIKKVNTIDDYKLILTFSNQEKRLFDMKPYLNIGIFRELQDISLFNTAHISFDTVEWNNDADFDPEILYKYSKTIKEKKYRKADSLISSVAEPKPI